MKHDKPFMKAACATAAAILVFLCLGQAGAGAAERMTIKGSTTILPIAQVIAEEFMDENPDIGISLQGGGSGVGMAGLIDGTTDIANASRGIKPAEIEKAESRGVSPSEHVIALDGIAVVVHPSNPVKGRSTDQIRAVYAGRFSNWEELGGPRSKIVVISRDSSSGTFETFEELALAGEKVRPDSLTLASSQAVVQTVSQPPGAIGYVGFGYLGSRVRSLEVDGIPCSRESILGGAYLLSRPLFMYTNGEPAGCVKKFLDFVLTPRGEKLVEVEGFLGLR